MSRLAETYYRQGRYDEALKLNQECLERMKIILGESHPDTLKVIFNLVHTHSEMGQLSKAAALVKGFYQNKCVDLGGDHVGILAAMRSQSKS